MADGRHLEKNEKLLSFIHLSDRLTVDRFRRSAIHMTHKKVFLRTMLILLPHYRVKSPKHSFWELEYARCFQVKRAKYSNFRISKLMQRFQTNFVRLKRPPSTLHVFTKCAPQIQDADGRPPSWKSINGDISKTVWLILTKICTVSRWSMLAPWTLMAVQKCKFLKIQEPLAFTFMRG